MVAPQLKLFNKAGTDIHVDFDHHYVWIEVDDSAQAHGFVSVFFFFFGCIVLICCPRKLTVVCVPLSLISFKSYLKPLYLFPLLAIWSATVRYGTPAHLCHGFNVLQTLPLYKLQIYLHCNVNSGMSRKNTSYVVFFANFGFFLGSKWF